MRNYHATRGTTQIWYDFPEVVEIIGTLVVAAHPGGGAIVVSFFRMDLQFPHPNIPLPPGAKSNSRACLDMQHDNSKFAVKTIGTRPLERQDSIALTTARFLWGTGVPDEMQSERLAEKMK